MNKLGVWRVRSLLLPGTTNDEHASQRNKIQNIGSSLPLVVLISMAMRQRKNQSKRLDHDENTFNDIGSFN